LDGRSGGVGQGTDPADEGNVMATLTLASAADWF